jgi:hypothetical protein
MQNENSTAAQKNGSDKVEPQSLVVIKERSNSNRFQIDYPASETYNKFTPEQIRALCELDAPLNLMFRNMPPWDTITAELKHFYRIKAYWTLRGAKDPGMAATLHLHNEERVDEVWDAESRAHGWPVFHPKNLHDLEKEFLPTPLPNIYLIISRCPQIAMIHALRGDVSEPYWWAALSITEHATPNLSRECSDGYAGFSEVELNSRIGRIHDESKKPALCERLNLANPKVCSLCKFQGMVRTPIALGFENEPKAGKVSHE